MDKKQTSPAAADDPFGSLVGYHLRRLSVLAMTDLSKALAPLGLKPADASVLFSLAANPGITQSDMGKTLGIRRANMAPLIAALVERGLIDRQAVDGRSQALRLSASGRLLQSQARKVTETHEQLWFGELAPDARGDLIALLRGLWQERV